VGQRLPKTPATEGLERDWQSEGRHGGDLRLLLGSERDLRQITVYGYARLVGYDAELNLVPDLAERIEVEDGRIFTIHLRPGHRWSDGTPFTAEDFRYWWEDVVNNPELYQAGPPIQLRVAGELPKVEFLDDTTIRFTWSGRNPTFLHDIAGPRPLYLYRPAHYLKRFHKAYTDMETLQARAEAYHQRDWTALHHFLDELYKQDNPDLPTLQPWINTTQPPSKRFVFERNPYYHRVDPKGRQLPYIDRLLVNVADPSIIPAKTGAGETDLQARYIRFDNYTFLKEAQGRFPMDVRLWRPATGAKEALYPNLNVSDPVWRELMRDVRFRRALSLAIDRAELNQVIYYGLALPGNNTVLPRSPLYKQDYRQAWAQFDLDQANALLDEIGLTERDGRGYRKLPDGRRLEIVVETAGESTEETDLLELIGDSWKKAGVSLHSNASQREVFRRRIFSGEAMMGIWKGLENGVPTPEMSPAELAPVSQYSYQWPKWGQYWQTNGQSGQPVDMDKPERLLQLYKDWRRATDRETRAQIWHEMLSIHAQQQYTIGLVAEVPQPVVVHSALANLPKEGLYNWDPGSFFGMYRLDATYWVPGNDAGRGDTT
jgi:peptide/nickel transport system substrate-binding protein